MPASPIVERFVYLCFGLCYVFKDSVLRWVELISTLFLLGGRYALFRL
jgi:hypothetical protein